MELEYRTEMFNGEAIDVETRSVNLAFSSEEPVERSSGNEILGHGENEVDLSFLRSGSAPLLLDHDQKKQIGVIENVRVENGTGRATVRFGKSALATEIFDDVTDGIRKNISVGYLVKKVDRDDENNSFRAINWAPKEISIVSIPADQTVGVGRSDENINNSEENTSDEKINKETITLKRNVTVMDNETIDYKQKEKDAVQAERTRSADILALGEKFDLVTDARAWIESGKDAAGFTNIVLEKVSERNTAFKTESDTTVDFSEKEKGQYSLARALYASATKDYRDAGLELEASRDLETKLGRRSAGLLVPMNVLSERAMSAGGVATGSELVGDNYMADQFVSPLYNSTIVKDLGATVLSNLVGNVTIPKGGSATANWVSENGVFPKSTPSTGNITLSPKTISGFVEYSHKLLLQGDPSVDRLVRNDLANVLRVAIDTAALAGTGVANQPRGILNTPGVNVVSLGTNGGVPTWQAVNDLVKEVLIDNLSGNAFAINPQVLTTLKTTPKVSGTDSVMIMGDSDQLIGYNTAVTNSIPSNLTKGTGTNLSAAIFGEFSNIFIAEYSILDLSSSDSNGNNFENGMVSVRAMTDVDVAVRRPEAFAVITDMITV